MHLQTGAAWGIDLPSITRVVEKDETSQGWLAYLVETQYKEEESKEGKKKKRCDMIDEP